MEEFQKLCWYPTDSVFGAHKLPHTILRMIEALDYLAFAERQIGFTILGGIEVVTGCHQQGRSPPLIGCDELLKLPRVSTDVCVPSISFEETVIIAI